MQLGTTNWIRYCTNWHITTEEESSNCVSITSSFLFGCGAGTDRVQLFAMPAYWLRRKFNKAVQRRRETRSVLATLLGKRNPHSPSGRNYTQNFFMRQWDAQRAFQADHTEVEERRMKQMAAMYERENVIELIRLAHAPFLLSLQANLFGLFVDVGCAVQGFFWQPSRK